MNSSFWSGKKVLITGHTGFKGSWLSLWLKKLGAEVSGYALAPPTTPSLFHLAGLADKIMSIEGDIIDFPRLQETLKTVKPEIVIHMAAQSLVRASYSQPVETFATNVMGTVHLLESVRQCDSVQALLCVTSDKCYENKEWYWSYRENEPMGGHDPYSSSKGCAELAVAAYRKSYFLGKSSVTQGCAIATVRAGNVVGGGDWALNRLVPDTMRAFMKKKAVVLRYPFSIRPWQHVLDPLCGYLCLVEKLWTSGSDFAEGWNFGPGDEDSRSVCWVVERLAKSWGDEAFWEADENESPHEAHYLKLDSSKARTRLKWKVILPIHQALEWTVAWYRAYHEDKDMGAFTMEQIHNFEELCRYDFS